MFVGEDVDDLLPQLTGRHVIPMLGGADQVVAHGLFLSFLGSVLAAVRLKEGRGKLIQRRFKSMCNTNVG